MRKLAIPSVCTPNPAATIASSSASTAMAEDVARNTLNRNPPMPASSVSERNGLRRVTLCDLPVRIMECIPVSHEAEACPFFNLALTGEGSKCLFRRKEPRERGGERGATGLGQRVEGTDEFDLEAPRASGSGKVELAG